MGVAATPEELEAVAKVGLPQRTGSGQGRGGRQEVLRAPGHASPHALPCGTLQMVCAWPVRPVAGGKAVAVGSRAVLLPGRLLTHPPAKCRPLS